jgi:hypothetical protein
LVSQVFVCDINDVGALLCCHACDIIE